MKTTPSRRQATAAHWPLKGAPHPFELPQVGKLPSLKLAPRNLRISHEDLRIPGRDAIGLTPPAKPMILEPDMDFGATIQRSRLVRPPLPNSLETLLLQRSGVDPHTHPHPLKRTVLEGGPGVSPFQQDLLAIPLAGLDPTQPLRRRLPKRQQDVGMVVTRVVSLFRDRRMDGDIRHHALTHEHRPHKPENQFLALVGRKLMR